jgi:hypothetical protein
LYIWMSVHLLCFSLVNLSFITRVSMTLYNDRKGVIPFSSPTGTEVANVAQATWLLLRHSKRTPVILKHILLISKACIGNNALFLYNRNRMVERHNGVPFKFSLSSTSTLVCPSDCQWPFSYSDGLCNQYSLCFKIYSIKTILSWNR